MRIGFNPTFNNKTRLNNSIKNVHFQSKQSQNDTFVKSTPEMQNPKVSRAYGKKFSYPDANGAKTDVYFWQMSEEKAKNTLPASIREICIENQVDPTEDIFIVSGINKDNKRYVLFNSNFEDKQTKTNQVQYFYMTSSTDELTSLQKNAYRIFYDSKNKHTLAQNSVINPLAQITSTKGITTSALLKNQIDCWANLSKEMQESQLADDNGNVYPIIYTADGHYTRYKTFKI